MEYHDLFNEDRIPLSKKIERGKKLANNEFRQVIHIVIFNSRDQMLIQRRSLNKKSFPGLWDVSASGSVISGETSKQGARRELFEELGIDYDFSNERAYFTINFDGGFDDFYFLHLDLDLNKLKLQADEVCEARWASKDDIINFMNENKFVPFFKSFVLSLFELHKKRGIIS